MCLNLLETLNHLISFLIDITIGFAVNSCRKDSKGSTPSVTDPVVKQAKDWYDSSYPTTTANNGSATKTTNSVAGNVINFGQHIKPDWQHPATYARLGKNVIEMPVDPSVTIAAEYKNMTSNVVYGDKKYNRSSFLLLNDGQGYQAYVMMIMADPAYVGNDLTKLTRNTYRKLDAAFTGLILYFKPDGRFVSGNKYLNGQLVLPAAENTSGGQVLSLKQGQSNKATDQLQTQSTTCTDYYLITYYDDGSTDSEFIGTVCNPCAQESTAGCPTGGTTGGGGSSGTTTTTVDIPAATCGGASPGGSTGNRSIGVNMQPAPGTGGGAAPPNDACTSTTTTTTTAIFGINGKNSQIPDGNFDNFLDYLDSRGLTYSDPFNSTLNVNGVNYLGQITEIYNPDGTIVTYFSPNVTSGPFETGMEYAIDLHDPSSTTAATIVVVEIIEDGINYGNPSIIMGTGKVSYTGGVGGTASSVLVITTTALTKDFPCATKLIVKQLLTISAYSNLVAPFATTRKPDLIWQNAALPWNAAIANSTQTTYVLGQTGYDGRSATITLNTSMLQHSSQLLIAAAAIHETLHAYINYNIETAVGGFLPPQDYNTAGSWLYSLDTWATIDGLPSNYRDHYQMLSTYFSDAVNCLAQWDNNAHTPKEYAEAMLYGLNNDTDGSTAQKQLLQTEYNSLLSTYGITPADLATFNVNQLNAPSTTDRLPTSGC